MARLPLHLAPALVLLMHPPAAAAFVPVPPSSTALSSSSALYTKNPDRARMEKELENMMDRDWRAFRANLVMNEKAEAMAEAMEDDKERAGGSATGGGAQFYEHEHGGRNDEKLGRQEKLGSLFAGAFSSIFSPGSSGSSSRQQQQKKEKDDNDEDHRGVFDRDIFDGDAVGGATVFSALPPSSSSCDEDPFVTESEIPSFVVDKPSDTPKLDKHRWAHPIAHIEPGCVLVANERLGGVFHQTVVLIIDHHEATGSTGIVINRPMPGKLLKVASETPSNVDLSLKLAFNTATVSYGGPVLQEEYSILHGYGEVEGSKKVAPGVFVGGSEELMNEVRRRNFRPDQSLFVKGHAAWVPSQLSREISKGVWYPASVSADLILRYAGAPVDEQIDNSDDLWSDILTCIGGDYGKIAEQHAGRGDLRMMP